jgi:hypothetical protein
MKALRAPLSRFEETALQKIDVGSEDALACSAPSSTWSD